MVPISSRKSVPPLATSNRPFFAVDRRGEGAFDVAEERRLQQLRRHRARVDGNERPVAARRVRVDCLRDQLLARAALALDQNGGAARRNLRDEVEEAKHGLALADDIFEVVALLQRALELNDLFFSAMPGNRGTNVGEQLLVVPRLLNEVLRAGANGIHHVAHRTVGRDHDDRKIRLHLDDARQKVDAALSRQRQVEQQKIVLVARQQVESRRCRRLPC